MTSDNQATYIITISWNDSRTSHYGYACQMKGASIEKCLTFILFWMDIRKISDPLWLRFGRGLSLLSLNNSQSSKKESVRASKLLPISSFLPFFSQFGIQFHYQKIDWIVDFLVDLKFVLIWFRPMLKHFSYRMIYFFKFDFTSLSFQ